MPIMREVGPIVMDPSIQECSRVLADEIPIVFDKVILDKIEHPDSAFFP